MTMQLVVIAGPDLGRSFELTEGDTLLIGRGSDSGTQLRDPRVSRKHCTAEVEGGQVRLSHLGGSSGTQVNGNPVSEHQLQPGDVIQVGETQIRFQLESASDAASTMFSEPISEQPRSTEKGDLRALIGTTVHNYLVEEEIAEGATGIVFLAKDTTKNNEPLALKVLAPEISRDEEQMQRFVRAMKTMFPIRHPNIVQIYNAGRAGENWWIAMEYVDGESLTQVIERIGVAGMLDWQQAFGVAVHIARALTAAAEHQIIHRNVSPQNILLRSADNVAKLGDLMLAKALEGTLAEQITRPGQLIGELAYMSPERTRGGADVDGRSDIYSLGATIYALLTGRPPFESKSLPELISQIRDREPVQPKEFQLSIADMFQDAVLRMLAKRPEDRYESPQALLTDLERVGQFQGITV